MNTVMVNLKNFTFAHDIFVLNDNNEMIDKISSSMKNIVENTVEKCNLWNTTKIKLIGNQKYANKLIQDIQMLGMTKYNLSFDIEII